VTRLALTRAGVRQRLRIRDARGVEDEDDAAAVGARVPLLDLAVEIQLDRVAHFLGITFMIAARSTPALTVSVARTCVVGAAAAAVAAPERRGDGRRAASRQEHASWLLLVIR
jgi:hypothetical protein